MPAGSDSQDTLKKVA